MIYEKILRPILFRFTDPEKIHHFTINGLGIVSRINFLNQLITSQVAPHDNSLRVTLGNLKLNSPVGLAAGFDKYIEAPFAYSMLGFGFAEFGSITYSPQKGNPLPRVWRLPKDNGLIVYYGLPNLGAKKTSELVSKINTRPIPLGISIAPTTGLKLEEMADDYANSFRELSPVADYITLNVSCPNVASSDIFSQLNFIKQLTKKISALRQELKPDLNIFLKIGPHHSQSDLKEIIDDCIQNKITGIIATNLLKQRTNLKFLSSEKETNHPGGISGKILQNHSDETIKFIYQESQGKLKIIGVGGVFSAADAYRKIRFGASAVELLTGFIYGGPLALRNINNGLSDLLKKDGFSSISEAVGIDAGKACCQSSLDGRENVQSSVL